ncbi:MAG: M2 family metallopeptidase [Chlamydiae bacterium]|nr:M2 family metallopeptidase [Chlamydiota bacterium]
MTKLNIFLICFIIALKGFCGEINQNKEFQAFLDEYVFKLADKSKSANLATWLLETTGSKEAASLSSSLNTELNLLFNDEATYKKLIAWQNAKSITDPILERELNVLIRSFKANMAPKELLEEISKKESELSSLFNNFRVTVNGKKFTDNEVWDVLQNESSVEKRKKVWEASKELGDVLAPKIIELVKLRNKVAKFLGYANFFDMQLELSEVNKTDLLKLFNDTAEKSNDAYKKMMLGIDTTLSKKFNVKTDEIGPWLWKDPFCQEDPIALQGMDNYIKNVDILAVAKSYYNQMNLNPDAIIKNSDLFEREGKNPHSFTIDIDRKLDVRTLCNIKPHIRWMNTVLHEFGHAFYELGYKVQLPWLLREPPHFLTTEAVALLMGRQSINPLFLKEFFNVKDEEFLKQMGLSLARTELIFSRYVLVMTEFENELYKNPDQDLNDLWWALVKKYQMVNMPENRKGKNDWATKYHIALAPVYYYSYLMGEFFAAGLEKKLIEISHSPKIWNPKSGEFLNAKVFYPGDSNSWDKLVSDVLGEPLSSSAWLEEFAR